jgi:hypothetical protein
MRSRQAELASFARELERQNLEWQQLVDALSRIESNKRFRVASSVLDELEGAWARPPLAVGSSALRA